ncbi:HAD family hydrolase [Desulfurivibrio sp. C05AmB]|uniref:HAD family hydrolase n=1 Tax=Desulfurivibrio sp. C05AmB TaxID=3374371 RepID=UPI00376EFD4E
MALIFDLDQTLIDSSMAEPYRHARNWGRVYSCIPFFKIYPGISEALNEIQRRNIAFAIVTSSPQAYCDRVLSFFNIRLNHKVCYHDTVRKKPHPEPILLAIKKLNIPPSNILSFGDKDIDIFASNSANVKSVACLWGADNVEGLIASKPTYILHSPLEIIDLLDTEIVLQNLISH